jgi:hypothetical protein
VSSDIIRSTNAVSEFSALIEVASPVDLRLRPPVGSAKFSPDLMTKTASRPPVGVQGLVLDAMDDERLTVKEARSLLDLVNERISKEADYGR